MYVFKTRSARTGEKRNVYKIFMQKSYGKRQAGGSRPNPRRDDNTKMDKINRIAERVLDLSGHVAGSCCSIKCGKCLH
jgi:hypothetical protein